MTPNPNLGTFTLTLDEVSRYENIGRDIGRVVDEKQAAYGDSFDKSGGVMRILYPEGIPLDKLDDALTVVRVLDKLFRIATDRDALGESPWRDIAGYSILAAQRTADMETVASPEINEETARPSMLKFEQEESSETYTGHWLRIQEELARELGRQNGETVETMARYDTIWNSLMTRAGALLNVVRGKK